MLEMKSCRRKFETDENSSDFEEIVDNHESCERFTNFSVSEILKPEFGRKNLTVGVLNLSSERRADEQASKNTLQYCYSWASHANITHHFGLDISAYQPYISTKITNTNLYVKRFTNDYRDIENINKNAGFKLKVNRKHDILTKNTTHRNTESRLSLCESDGESVQSTPTTSPAGSPDSGTVKSVPEKEDGKLWPAWVYCTRYSDRPSAGPRSRKIRRKDKAADDKRPRTAFSTEQLSKLKDEFETNKYLSESRRQQLARELNLYESQIKIWFQNKRAKIKKGAGERNELALELIAQGLYNHKTVKLES